MHLYNYSYYGWFLGSYCYQPNITTIRITTALLQLQTPSLPLQPKQIYCYYTHFTQLGVIMQLKTPAGILHLYLLTFPILVMIKLNV